MPSSVTGSEECAYTYADGDITKSPAVGLCLILNKGKCNSPPS
jgi:hypothetical protein